VHARTNNGPVAWPGSFTNRTVLAAIGSLRYRSPEGAEGARIWLSAWRRDKPARWVQPVADPDRKCSSSRRPCPLGVAGQLGEAAPSIHPRSDLARSPGWKSPEEPGEIHGGLRIWPARLSTPPFRARSGKDVARTGADLGVGCGDDCPGSCGPDLQRRCPRADPVLRSGIHADGEASGCCRVANSTSVAAQSANRPLCPPSPRQIRPGRSVGHELKSAFGGWRLAGRRSGLLRFRFASSTTTTHARHCGCRRGRSATESISESADRLQRVELAGLRPAGEGGQRRGAGAGLKLGSGGHGAVFGPRARRGVFLYRAR